MSKDIKTRTVLKDVKTIDKAKVAAEHIHHATIKSKEQCEEDTPHDYAVNKTSENVPRYTKNIVVNARVNEKRYRNHRKEKNAIKALKKDYQNDVSPMFQQDRPIKAKTYKRCSVFTNNRTMKTGRTNKKDIKTIDNKEIKHFIKAPKKDTKVSIKIPSQNKNAAKQYAIQSMKKSKESASAMKQIAMKSSNYAKKITKATTSAFKKMFESAKEVYLFISAIGSVACLLILVIALFGGIFMGGGSSSPGTAQLSQEVIAYTPLIQKYANEFEIPLYVNAIQAIMMQESGGKGNDPMQSSECAFNTKYPNKSNGITDPEYSIKVGIENFADCIKRAKCKDPFDIKNLSLAWQGYNYGNGYIEWAVKNFGGYSQGNAQVFSEEQAIKLGWSSYGDPEYVPHVMRYYQFAQLGTGNSQLVNVALTQLGNKGGILYWSWWGYSSRVEWCAIFISWCSEQCGMLQDGSIPKFENVTVGMNWFKERNQWLTQGSVPSEGMIIFFDWNNDHHCDHVGIVEKTVNDVVYTIEGNSNDEVRRNTYSVNSNVIMGYGTIKK
ncbi:hypothetical protein Aargi30884_17270 [Amedibacterium intestinale]|uniref:Uncharacterized protein n=1 Tax=Amedibacterium intestinale TaxID=2583452 RepID=A0A6N4TK21_9FIRM|nr:lysozyme family protein [Amedibacterium intestinale]BBK22824.1 hypothetical protein Aargi30884_17270 [Amedibacterium intestinale]